MAAVYSGSDHPSCGPMPARTLRGEAGSTFAFSERDQVRQTVTRRLFGGYVQEAAGITRQLVTRSS
jgi:hypothetical protein